MRTFNPLCLLALLSVIAVLGFLTDNKGWFGFFGFFYYVRYFRVLPDEFFSKMCARRQRSPFLPACSLSLSMFSSSVLSLIPHAQPPWPSASALPLQ